LKTKKWQIKAKPTLMRMDLENQGAS
jgi:hypothetical protein